MKRLLMIEVGLVAATLCGVAMAGGGNVSDWCAATAVLIGFIHSALSLEAATELSKSTSRISNVSSLIRATFMMKEGCWLVTFILLGSYPLTAGAVLFITYPSWHAALQKLARPEMSRFVSESYLPLVHISRSS